MRFMADIVADIAVAKTELLSAATRAKETAEMLDTTKVGWYNNVDISSVVLLGKECAHSCIAAQAYGFSFVDVSKELNRLGISIEQRQGFFVNLEHMLLLDRIEEMLLKRAWANEIRTRRRRDKHDVPNQKVRTMHRTPALIDA